MAWWLTVSDRSLAIVGAGWSGVAAAVQACDLGREVTLFEMAGHVGGRARSVTLEGGLTLDNGQHILIGAYSETLRLMAQVGADPAQLLMRLPLEFRYPDGRGMKLGPGPPALAFALAVATAKGWTWADRWQLLRTALGWWHAGMRNPGVSTVSELCASLPARIRSDLMDPLCVAALNTPPQRASATVFLRVLADALFHVAHGSDLLLPRVSLSEVFPGPALRWLQARGCQVVLGQRVQQLARTSKQWLVDGQPFHDVVLACTVTEAARLVRPFDRPWSDAADALVFEPIVTIYLNRSGPALACPMMALCGGPDAPAQFAFDLSRLSIGESILAFVVSGARHWLSGGLDALARAVQRQAVAALPAQFPKGTAALVHAAAERRATFACTADLARPAQGVTPGLVAAGDYVAGPYPATLEGAVRSGVEAARMVCR